MAELSIVNNKNNALIGREEIVVIVKPQVSYDETKKLLAEKTKKPVELIVIKRANAEFGKKEVKVEAYIYKSEEIMKKFEPKPKVKKGASAQAEPAAA
jgi:ribosomal protein S24E